MARRGCGTALYDEDGRDAMTNVYSLVRRSSVLPSRGGDGENSREVSFQWKFYVAFTISSSANINYVAFSCTFSDFYLFE